MTFHRNSALTLYLLQLQLFSASFQIPDFTQIKQVRLLAIKKLLPSQTKEGHIQHTNIPYHSPIMSQSLSIMSFMDNLPPRQAKYPNLEGKDGGVDNSPYGNDTSNFPTPTANDTYK